MLDVVLQAGVRVVLLAAELTRLQFALLPSVLRLPLVKLVLFLCLLTQHTRVLLVRVTHGHVTIEADCAGTVLVTQRTHQWRRVRGFRTFKPE